MRGTKAKKMKVGGRVLGRRIIRIEHLHAPFEGNYERVRFEGRYERDYWSSERVPGYVAPEDCLQPGSFA